MELGLELFGVMGMLELLIWLSLFQRFRRQLALVLMVLVAVSSTWLLMLSFSTWTVLLAIFSLYRLINLRRLNKSRVQVDYLYNATLKTSVWLIGCQLVIIGITGLVGHNHINILSCFYGLAAIQLIISLIILASTIRHLRTTKPPQTLDDYADRDLPSLTVCIPARNETDSLQACLESLLANNYPKLEVLVLDDCSQDRRTSDIIRGFAHQGVRFMAGEAPGNRWLAKNYAYSQLAAEANGELLLFCGVDTRFSKDSLAVLVKTLLKKQKTMISLIPANSPPRSLKVLASLIQPNRYAWELALPRRLMGRPPVLSSCWLITSQALMAAGGFDAVCRQVVPESYFARQIARTNDGYSLLQSTPAMGVTTQKSLDNQKNTATRVRYPQLHRRPELVVLTSLIEFTALVWPLLILIVALISQIWLLAALAGTAYVLQTLAYAKIVNLTYRQHLLRGLWLLPVAAIYDIGLLNYSMWQYEFNEVTWKGRNVCLPVMRVIPRLPRLP